LVSFQEKKNTHTGQRNIQYKKDEQEQHAPACAVVIIAVPYLMSWGQRGVSKREVDGAMGGVLLSFLRACRPPPATSSSVFSSSSWSSSAVPPIRSSRTRAPPNPQPANLLPWPHLATAGSRRLDATAARRLAHLPGLLISYLCPNSPPQGADDWTPRPCGTSPTSPAG
jgi:hypothetical protein